MLEIIKKTLKDLEKIAEPSSKEFKTTKYIADFLKSNNIPVDKILETGCFGTFDIGAEKTVAFRADIDALPVDSSNKCFKHLCGHHAHTASLLLSLADIVKNKAKLKKNIRYIFQPAEETGKGAEIMIENGAVDNVDEIYSLHGDPEHKIGELCLKKGFLMAGACLFKLKIRGKNTHAAFPHKGNDVIAALAEYINICQKIVSRFKDPTKEALISFCVVKGGYAPNILPESVETEGTFRFFRDDEKLLIKNKMRDILKAVEMTYNVKGEIEFDFTTNPVKNDERLIEKIKSNFSHSDIKIIEDYEAMMGSEDFSAFLDRIPGVYMKVGIAKDENHPPLHNQNFYVQPEAVMTYINIWKQLAFL